MNLDYFRVREKVSIYGILACSFALLNFVLTAYLVLYQDCNWKGRVYSQLICELFFSFIYILMVIGHIGHILHIKRLRQPHAVALGLIPLVAGRGEVADVNLVGHSVTL